MTTRLCNIPALTLPPCDLAWGHAGDLHSNGGDGFGAARHLEEHHRRQRVVALQPPLDRGPRVLCCACHKPDDNLQLLLAKGGSADPSAPCCVACYAARPDLRESYDLVEMPTPIPLEILSCWCGPSPLPSEEVLEPEVAQEDLDPNLEPEVPQGDLASEAAP